MTEFVRQINKYTQLSKEAETDFLSKLKSKSYKKGDIINKEGQICKQMYFIENGLVKHYYIDSINKCESEGIAKKD